MEPRLHKKWESLENQRKRLIEKLKPLSEAQLSHSPAPGSWSINEVLNHVIQSESGTLGYMRKKSQA
ncbi:MAG: DinB family protein, partial [Calditrichaeota bacterium]